MKDHHKRPGYKVLKFHKGIETVSDPERLCGYVRL